MEICLLVLLLGKNVIQLNEVYERTVKQVANREPALLFSDVVTYAGSTAERSEAFIAHKAFSFLNRWCRLSGHSKPSCLCCILTAGGYKTETALLGDIGREENVVVLSLDQEEFSVSDERRFPTLVPLRRNGIDQFIRAVHMFLRHIDQHKYTFIHDGSGDDDCTNMQHRSSNQEYESIREYSVVSSNQGSEIYGVARYNFTVSSCEKNNLTVLMEKMWRTAKVYVLVGSLDTARRFMPQAGRLQESTTESHLVVIKPLVNPESQFEDLLEHSTAGNKSLSSQALLLVCHSQGSPISSTSLIERLFLKGLRMLTQMTSESHPCASFKGFLPATDIASCLRNKSFEFTQPSSSTNLSDTFSFRRFDIVKRKFETVFKVDSTSHTLQQTGLWDFSDLNVTEKLDAQPSFTSDVRVNHDESGFVMGIFGAVLGMVVLTLLIRLWRRVHRFTGLSWAVDERLMRYVSSYTLTIGKWTLPQTGVGGSQGTVHVYDGKLLTTAVSFPIYVDISEIKKNHLAKLTLKLARDLDHPNVSKFYGIMWTTNHSIFGRAMVHVSEHTTKGFLRHVIDDDSVALNWDLRFCLMWDLFLGFRYIHESQLRCHGCLTSICAYVDERFTLKINGAGILPYFGVLLRTARNVERREDTFSPVLKMQRLWMAPEVLVDLKDSWTTAADTYSFGVLLYEMSTLNSPFNIDMNDEEFSYEVGRKMDAGTFEPIDMDLELDTVPPDLATLMLSCWDRDKTQRPSLKSILQSLESVYPQRSGMSFGDSLVERMMQYSVELEEKVALQTENLLAEAHRVDNLLCDLLPYDIVRRLRRAVDIDLEYCDSVTVMFSDIPIFSEIVGKVSPFQLFAMLEHMCRALDVIVAGFTVFKVETIRDSYMVVGGIPVHIGNRHAAEVANLALAMLSAVRSLPSVQEYHLEDWMVFEARAGIHSGPVVAGIIGTKLPHYTIFGDTVNTASRMETSGEASRIQISRTTYEILEGREEYKLESRGLVPIKGKGDVETFWLTSAQAIRVSISDLELLDKSKPILGNPTTKNSRQLRRFARPAPL